MSNAGPIQYYVETNKNNMTVAESGVSASVISLNSARIPYLCELNSDDPFSNTSMWHGKLAESLGLRAGSVVGRKEFENLYYGYSPNGKRKLKENIGDKKDQFKANTDAALIDRKIVKIKRKMFKIRRILKLLKYSDDDIKKNECYAPLMTELGLVRQERQVIAQNPHKRQAVVDINFSVPKPATMLMMALMGEGDKAGADSIVEAFRESVVEVLNEIESDLVKTRPRAEDLTRKFLSANGSAFSLFTHFDARPTLNNPSDPQLHVHALMFQLVEDQDGQIQTPWTRHINNCAPMLGTRMRALFAQRLMAMGFTTLPYEYESKKGRAFKIAGITDESAAEMSKRHDQIKDNKKHGMGDKSASLHRRLPKNKDMTGSELLKITSKRLNEMGISGDLIRAAGSENYIAERLSDNANDIMSRNPSVDQKTAEGWARKKLMTEIERSRADLSPTELVGMLLEKAPSFTIIDARKLIYERLQTLPVVCNANETIFQATERKAAELLLDLLKSGDLCQVSGSDRATGVVQFTSRAQINKEIDFYTKTLPALMADGSKKGLNRSEIETQIERAENEKTNELQKKLDLEDSAELNKLTARLHRAKLVARPSKFKIAQLEKACVELAANKVVAPFEFSEKQRSAMFKIAGDDRSMNLMLAWAGTGKTTLARPIVRAYEAAGRTVIAIAPTNAAAKKLGAELGDVSGPLKAFTPESLESALANHKLNLNAETVLYIDEASLLDFKESEKMLNAALSARCKIIFTGDPAQLCSIDLGNVIRNIVNEPKFDDACFRLTATMEDSEQVQRQRDPEQKRATAFLQLNRFVEGLEIYAQKKCLDKHYDGQVMMESAMDDYLTGLSTFSERVKSAREMFVSESSSHSSSPVHSAACRQYQEALAIYSEKMSDRLLIATTKDMVGKLNLSARSALKSAGSLGSVNYRMGRGPSSLPMEISLGERICFSDKLTVGHAQGRREFLKSQAATVVAVESQKGGNLLLTLMIDSDTGGAPQELIVDTAKFNKFVYDYAHTTHSLQGRTTRHTTFVATPDREDAAVFITAESALVSMTRHRDTLKIHCLESSYDQFVKRASTTQTKTEARDLHQAFIGDLPEEFKNELSTREKDELILLFEEKIRILNGGGSQNLKGMTPIEVTAGQGVEVRHDPATPVPLVTPTHVLHRQHSSQTALTQPPEPPVPIKAPSPLEEHGSVHFGAHAEARSLSPSIEARRSKGGASTEDSSPADPSNSDGVSPLIDTENLAKNVADPVRIALRQLILNKEAANTPPKATPALIEPPPIVIPPPVPQKAEPLSDREPRPVVPEEIIFSAPIKPERQRPAIEKIAKQRSSHQAVELGAETEEANTSIVAVPQRYPVHAPEVPESNVAVSATATRQDPSKERASVNSSDAALIQPEPIRIITARISRMDKKEVIIINDKSRPIETIPLDDFFMGWDIDKRNEAFNYLRRRCSNITVEYEKSGNQYVVKSVASVPWSQEQYSTLTATIENLSRVQGRQR